MLVSSKTNDQCLQIVLNMRIFRTIGICSSAHIWRVAGHSKIIWLILSSMTTHLSQTVSHLISFFLRFEVTNTHPIITCQIKCLVDIELFKSKLEEIWYPSQNSEFVSTLLHHLFYIVVRLDHIFLDFVKWYPMISCLFGEPKCNTHTKWAHIIPNMCLNTPPQFTKSCILNKFL